MNLLDKKLKLFNQDINDWNKFMQNISSKPYRQDVNDLLNNLKSQINQPPTINNISSRRFVGAFTMIKFDMFDKNDTRDVQLYYKSKELFECFDNIFSNNLNNKFIEIFFDNFTKYLNIFEKWKEEDEKKLIDKSCTQQYKEIQVIEQKFTGDTPDEQQLSKSASILKNKFEKRIKQIGGDRGMQYVYDSPKLKPINVMQLDMEENMKKAYWDLFEDEVNLNKLDHIGKNLDDFRKYFFELLGESNKAKDIKKEFDENVDLYIIKQMINGNTIDTELIFKIMKSLIWFVQKYIQSASEDKDSEILLENLYNQFSEGKEKTGTILRYFFQNLFTKLDKTKVQIKLLTIPKNDPVDNFVL